MSPPISEQVAQQAVRWLVELQGGANAQQRQDWQRWRDASPEHEQAWQRIEIVNQRLRGLSPDATRAALSSRSGASRRQVLGLLGLAGIAAPVAWFAGRQAHPWLADYQTRVGERRSLTLAEGSELTLNTDSAVNQPGERELILLRGEIQLQASAYPTPFRVRSAQAVLSTPEARLNLRQYADHCRLSVLSGRVEAACLHHPTQTISLLAGQQVRIDADGIGTPQPLQSAALAWSQGMLVADGMRLDAFLEELARYRQGWLRCSRQVAALRLSGTYPLADTQAILELLQDVLPVVLHQRTRYWVSVESRPA